jgi:hypothetical protein
MPSGFLAVSMLTTFTLLTGYFFSEVTSQKYIMLTTLILFLALLYVVFINQSHLISRNKGLLSFLAIAVLMCAPQVLQNSHTHPYGIAFKGYENPKYLKEFEKTEQFVLDQTKKKDRLMVWVEPSTELVEYAAAQLWGPNSVNHTLSFADWDKANLKASKPTHLVLYLRNTEIASEYISNLKKSGWSTLDQKCRKFSKTEIGDIFTVCVLKVIEQIQ